MSQLVFVYSYSGSHIQCWDHATRGLDSATALEFIRALKTSDAILNATLLIAIYQCSQDAYDLSDNVVVLYEGHEMFYGKANKIAFFFPHQTHPIILAFVDHFRTFINKLRKRAGRNILFATTKKVFTGRKFMHARAALTKLLCFIFFKIG